MPIMRPLIASGCVLAFASVFSGPVAAASCGQLWYQRNAIYAKQGYCFETPAAIAAFGPRCYPPYGKLTPRQTRKVKRIRAKERAKGC